MDADGLWPLAAYAVAVTALVASMIAISYLLGQRHREHATGEPYESGIAATGSARLRFDVKFYLVAILFVIFDLEAAFLFSYAVAVRELHWTGYIGALVFIGVLAVALVYEWKTGALEWAPGRARTRSARRDNGASLGSSPWGRAPTRAACTTSTRHFVSQMDSPAVVQELKSRFGPELFTFPRAGGWPATPTPRSSCS